MSGKAEKDKEGEELTPLTDTQKEILCTMQEDVIQMMTSRKIEMGSEFRGASSSPDDESILGGLDVPRMGEEIGKEVGKNKQNVNNWAREVWFGASIEL